MSAAAARQAASSARLSAEPGRHLKGARSQGRETRVISGTGAAAAAGSAQRSIRMATARSVRWPISRGVMQRSRFQRQRARSIASALAGPRNHHRPAALLSGILPVPDLEVEQRPQELLVVLLSVEVLGQHARERPGVVVGPGARSRAGEVLHQVVAHLAAEPLVDRDAEADLGTL